MIEDSSGLNSGQKGSRKNCVRFAEFGRYRTYLGPNMEINALHKCQASYTLNTGVTQIWLRKYVLSVIDSYSLFTITKG